MYGPQSSPAGLLRLTITHTGISGYNATHTSQVHPEHSPVETIGKATKWGSIDLKRLVSYKVIFSNHSAMKLEIGKGRLPCHEVKKEMLNVTHTLRN